MKDKEAFAIVEKMCKDGYSFCLYDGGLSYVAKFWEQGTLYTDTPTSRGGTVKEAIKRAAAKTKLDWGVKIDSITQTDTQDAAASGRVSAWTPPKKSTSTFRVIGSRRGEPSRVPLEDPDIIDDGATGYFDMDPEAEGW